MISRFFIDRPIFASVVSAFIVIAGLAAIRALPVAAYPDILPPEVEVTASYPGANSQTVAETVAAPLEQAINGVDGMLYLRSASAGNGSLSITVTFAIGTDPDLATINVDNRVQAALPTLPEEVRRQGVSVRKRSSTILQIATIDSTDPRHDQIYVSNYASFNVIDELRRIPGVGDAQNFGAKDYSIRVWMRPDRMAQLGLTPADIAAAIREQNAQFAAGRVGQSPTSDPVDFTFSVTTMGRLTEPEQFGEIILRTTPQGGFVKLKDVARIELGSRDYDFVGKRNGRPTVPIGIFLQPGANALEVGDAVRARLEELEASAPDGFEFALPYDTTKFVRVSIREVVKTLVESMTLVFAVVFLFLQNWRATLIPMLAVPVSLIGTFAAMLLFGFSINTLTLFGMVLSIGIVVDDAIVVLENVERIIMDEGLSPRAATIKAMEQVTGPVVAIVFVLTAVFLPVAFLGGLVGEMYRQFAVTIAVSVAISGFVALTLTPALCATLLRKEHATRHPFFARFNAWFARMTGRYADGVHRMMRHSALSFGLFAAMLVATAGLFKIVPSSLAPTEDQGYILAIPLLQDAASLDRTEAATDQLSEALLEHPAVAEVISFSGMDVLTFSMRTNAGVIWVNLKDWSERHGKDMSPGAVAAHAFGAGAKVRDAFILAFEPPPIEGLGATGGFEAYIQSRAGGDYKALEAAAQQLAAAAAQRKELIGVTSTFSASVPQMRVDLNREQAKLLGVNVTDVFDALQSTFGALYVNDFNRDGRVFRVHLQSDAEFRSRPDDIRDVFVRGGSGELIPLTALVTSPGGDRARGHRAVQRIPVGQGARQRGSGFQLRRGARDDGGGGGDCAARGLQARLDRDVLPGEADRRHLDHGIPGRRADGVPGSCRAIRAVDAALRGDPGRSLRGVRRVARRVPARARKRHLLPDRPRDAGRPRLEERDPDRRVRLSQGEGGDAARRGSDCGGTPAVAAHHHDLARIHPGCDAARPQHRCGCREPSFDRHGRRRRHAARDVRRDVLHPALLHPDRRLAPAQSRRGARAATG